jgi:hypothetical protein
MKQLLLRLAACAALAAGACHTPQPSQWVPKEIPMCSTMRLWEVTRLAMEKNGFPIVHQGFDPVENSVVSGWDRDLHPFRGNGIRERVYVRFKRSENAGKLVLGVRVEQEANDNLAKPLDPEYAVWVEAPDNPGRAKIVLQYMQSMLGMNLNLGSGKTGAAARRVEDGSR